MKFARSLLAVAALVAAGGAYWSLSKPTAVATVAPKRGDAAEIVYATGTVEPRNWAKVAALVRERVIERCDCEGQRVEQGQILARLDSAQAEATLAELKARQKLATAEHDRLAVLVERNVMSLQALDRARSEMSQASALIAGQTARLENYLLRAPMRGTVLRRDGEVGEIAEPGTVLFWIGEAKPLRVVAEVNEEDIPQVKPGQRVLIRADAFPGRALEGTVDSITPKGDPVAKTYRVYLALPDDTPLLIGMTVELNIIVRVAQNALLLPVAAVQGNAVFIVEGDVARRRELAIGIRGTGDVEVVSGLQDAARVIAPFPAKLGDGARVAQQGR
ncbi:RND transporter [Bosea sp. Root483D1]|uniref:efflux RND transporter periplasmic adaptor subunit n=1 Tax=Bosea sp. Root483D1 TaxID=1736544 RepID=UPI000710ECBF|nr:efflux RND transporter periplasmic adaptor subunit [Bosea sp. Root483D1]KRE12501.1 RND transporter [Bosea sp. Root483D1]